MAKFKDYLKIFIACIISAVVTLGLQSLTTRNEKIVNAASKDDVACVKYEMTEYTDNAKNESFKHTDEKFKEHEKVHDEEAKIDEMILKDLQIIKQHLIK